MKRKSIARLLAGAALAALLCGCSGLPGWLPGGTDAQLPAAPVSGPAEPDAPTDIPEVPEAPEKPEEPAPPEERTLTGALFSLGASTLTVCDENGARLTFRNGPAVSLCESPRRGCPVTVVYTGELPPSGNCTESAVVSVAVESGQGLDAGERAELLLRVMSTEEKVGQMFLTRTDAAPGGEDAAGAAPGGFILFAPDIADKTAPELSGAIAALQAGSEIPLLIAVDEEGGTVCRVSENQNLRSTRFLSPRRLYSQGGMEAVEADAAEKCALLLSLGINVNMAPVCDVCQSPEAFMYRRSFGGAEETAQYAAAVVGVMEEARLGSVLKHFPGYGENADTHTGSALDERPMESFRQSDFLPFAAGIDAGADAVLVCHNVVSCMDGQLPASLSPRVHQALREELGFGGVVITDDLIMEAVSGTYGAGEAAVLAVLAGNDLLCSAEYKTQYAAVLEAVYGGRVEMEAVNAAVLRVLTWKAELGII